MQIEITAARFPLGQVVITANAQRTLPPEDIPGALMRHVIGDWGDLDSEDKQANEKALATSGRLLSRYIASNNVAFYVITEWDRSYTTILLPEDY